MFRLANSTSQVYVEFYKPSEQLGVRFGDGLIGKIPRRDLQSRCVSGVLMVMLHWLLGKH